MKKILTITWFLIFSLAGFSQSIPNAGFENWVTTGNYTDPTFWDTPNQQTNAIPLIGGPVVTKSSGGHSGSWCAKLENKSFIVYTVPGIMTLGQFNINLTTQDFSLSGGVPFNQRPEKFKGYYKFSPQGGDTCAMLAVFFKHNPGGWQDTIGVAYFLSNSTVSVWTEFEALVDWYSAEDPDTMNILVSSTADFSPTAGSVLYVDDLSFDYASRVETLGSTKDNISVKYNKASAQIHVQCDIPGVNSANISLLNITGQTLKVINAEISKGVAFTIPVHGLPKGIYLVKIQAGSGRFVKKVVIN